MNDNKRFLVCFYKEVDGKIKKHTVVRESYRNDIALKDVCNEFKIPCREGDSSNEGYKYASLMNSESRLSDFRKNG